MIVNRHIDNNIIRWRETAGKRQNPQSILPSIPAYSLICRRMLAYIILFTSLNCPLLRTFWAERNANSFREHKSQSYLVDSGWNALASNAAMVHPLSMLPAKPFPDRPVFGTAGKAITVPSINAGHPVPYQGCLLVRCGFNLTSRSDFWICEYCPMN